MKNIYAIASGIAAGLGYESNTRAGLVTRSLAEMTRIGIHYEADPLTYVPPSPPSSPVLTPRSFRFLSLCGVGDLMLTCSSEKSRNYTVGYRLGKGETLEYIIKSLGSVAEGVDTTKASVPSSPSHQLLLIERYRAYSMTRERNISAPILEHVYRLLWEGGSAKELAEGLMNLPMMEEMTGVSVGA